MISQFNSSFKGGQTVIILLIIYHRSATLEASVHISKKTYKNIKKHDNHPPFFCVNSKQIIRYQK